MRGRKRQEKKTLRRILLSVWDEVISVKRHRPHYWIYEVSDEDMIMYAAEHMDEVSLRARRYKNKLCIDYE